MTSVEATKRCSWCGGFKALTDFSRRGTGWASWCRPCINEKSRTYRLANRDRIQERNWAQRENWRKANPELVRAQGRRWAAANRDRIRASGRAREWVRRAIDRGELVRPLSCEQCGATGKRIEAAHGDYTKPLEVRWLCKPCHARWDHARPKTKGIQPHYDRAIGTRIATAKLNEDAVRSIRERYANGSASGVQLAQEYGVGSTAIYQVLRGRTWSHVS